MTLKIISSDRHFSTRSPEKSVGNAVRSSFKGSLLPQSHGLDLIDLTVKKYRSPVTAKHRLQLLNHMWGAVMTAVLKPDWPMKRGGPEEYAPAIHGQNPSSNELSERMAALVGQAIAASFDQIDHVAGDLEKTRDALRREAEHLGRSIDNYVSLNNAAITAMKIISERLKAFQRPE
jgi:hypothetical protein